MKKASIFTSVVLLLVSTTLSAQYMPECLAIAELEMDPLIRDVAIHNSYEEIHQQIIKEFNGYNFYLLQGIRGERPDKYTLAMCFDLVEFRDYYYPTAGGNLSKSGMDKWKMTGLVQGMPYVKETKRHTDYILMGFDALVNPQFGEVVAIRYPEIKPDQEAEFERRLMEEWLEDLHKGIEGLSMYFLKADRGERKGKYLMLLVFDTYKRYRDYWTDEGQSTPLYQGVIEPHLEMIETISTYFEEGAFDSYTDYIALRW